MPWEIPKTCVLVTMETSQADSSRFKSSIAVNMEEVEIRLIMENVCDRAEQRFQQKNVEWDIRAFVDAHLQEFVSQLSEDEFQEIHTQLVVELEKLQQHYQTNSHEANLDEVQHSDNPNPPQHVCQQCGQKNDIPQFLTSALLVCKQCGADMHLKPLDSTRPMEDTDRLKMLEDRFKITKRLGAGGYGVVFLAWDKQLQREVAIKIPRMDRTHKNLLLREARAASQLKHPNIVRVYDVGHSEDLTYIISDYIEGMTLSRWSHRRQIKILDACRFLIVIAKAIEYAHSKGVIHRDLKPGNIMVDGDSKPHILDFGLSHSKLPAVESIGKTGQPIGTPAYMSPEQVTGKSKQVGPWTDVYGLGVILYQLLTGELPFSGASESIFDDIINEEPRPPQAVRGGIPAALNAIVLKCLAKNPQDRYHTAGELVHDLNRFVANESVKAYPHLEARVVKHQVRRFAAPAIIGMMSLILLVVVGWIKYQQYIDNPQTRFMIESDAETVMCIPFNDEAVDWDVEAGQELPTRSINKLKPGFYKIIANFDGQYQEVYRTIPGAENGSSRNFLGGTVFEGDHRASSLVVELAQFGCGA